jgi:hypothetical protein
VQVPVVDERTAPVDLPEGDGGRLVADDVPAEAVFDLYRDETRRADEIVGRTPGDAGPPSGS